MSSSTPITTTRWDARVWGALVVLCGAIFLDALDVSMVGVALPSIESDLGLSTSSLQWVVSGYVLGYGGFLLLGGRATDLLGRRRVFIVAIAAFAFASLLGGLVSSGPLLIATRFIKGMSAAFTAPAGLSLITTSFAEGPARNRALSIYTTCGASGFSLGLVMGGALTELGWRWTFLLPVPVALAILAAAPKYLPNPAGVGGPDSAGRRYDIAGAASITSAMLLLVWAVVEAPSAGWGSPQTVLALTGVAALIAAFVAIEQRTAQPLVRLAILRSGTLTRANLGGMAMFGSYVGFQFIGTLYMQTLLGWSAIETALAFLPAGLIVAFGSPRMGGLVERFGTPRLIAVAFTLFLAGYALFLRIDADPSYAWVILPSMLLIGGGFALAFPSLNIQATTGVADHEQGLASGLLNTSIQVGGAIGLAVVTAVVTSRTGAGDSAQSLLDGFRPGVIVATAAASLGLLAALVGVVAERGVVAAEPATS